MLCNEDHEIGQTHTYLGQTRKNICLSFFLFQDNAIEFWFIVFHGLTFLLARGAHYFDNQDHQPGVTQLGPISVWKSNQIRSILASNFKKRILSFPSSPGPCNLPPFSSTAALALWVIKAQAFGRRWPTISLDSLSWISSLGISDLDEKVTVFWNFWVIQAKGGRYATEFKWNEREEGKETVSGVTGNTSGSSQQRARDPHHGMGHNFESCCVTCKNGDRTPKFSKCRHAI